MGLVSIDIGDIDLRTVRIVQAIQEAGSMTAAAKMLGLSQPAISQHIRRAESRLGLPLVYRQGRGVRLAEAGVVICGIAPGVGQGLAFAADRLRELHGLGGGSIRMSGFSLASEAVLPAVVTRLRADNPEIALSYTEREPTAALEAIFAGECDAALIYRSPTSVLDAEWYDESAVTSRPLFDDEFFVALPTAHPLSTAPYVELSSLSSESWVVPTGDGRTCLMDLLVPAGVVPRVMWSTDNISASLQLVARGGGVCVVTQLALENRVVPPGVKLMRILERPTRSVEVVSLKLHAELPLVRAVHAVVRRIRRGQGTNQPSSPERESDGTRSVPGSDKT